MDKFVVNASTGEFRRGEIVMLDPRLYEDLIESQVLSPIDEYGNRVTADGEMLVLSSTTEEQRRLRETQIRPIDEYGNRLAE